MFTTWFTERAVEFIEKNKDRPFLVYVAHPMPHVPLFVSDKFAGKSERGLYGDVIMEIDWSVGQILAALKRLDLGENTLVIFTSDNGPWLSYGTHGGSALGKGTMFDGGCRVLCIMRWPARIPAGTVCSELAATIDILPTLAEILSVELPDDRIIDGKSILSLMEGKPDAKSPAELRTSQARVRAAVGTPARGEVISGSDGGRRRFRVCYLMSCRPWGGRTAWRNA